MVRSPAIRRRRSGLPRRGWLPSRVLNRHTNTNSQAHGRVNNQENGEAVGSRRSKYHWVVFGSAFFILLGAAGVRSTPGVLMDPLHKEFGWSHGTIGLAVSINVLLFGFIGPFAAALQQRYGLRRVTSVALLFMAAGAGLTTQMSHSWQLFLLWGVVVGAGSGCMATVFASTVASRWFIARRGIVTGALTAATASGQLVFLPLLTSLASHHGWRWVGAVVCLTTLSVQPVVWLFLRDKPSDIGLLPYGAPEGYEPPVMNGSPVANAFGALRAVREIGRAHV